MNSVYIRNEDFKLFIENLISTQKVVAPIEKKNKFIFDQLHHFSQLRLDYDVTILPPKKLFMPTIQHLVKFSKNSYEGCINSIPTILLGVHFYDVKAIDQIDFLMNEKYPDENYLAQRKATTIIASNIQNVNKRAFFSSVGKEASPKGHDAFLTKINSGFVFEVLTSKGEGLIKNEKFTKASDSQIQEAKAVNDNVLNNCHEKLQWSSKEISEKTRSSFKNKQLWTTLSYDCFSCGGCNITCPTCYCFDVHDHWNPDQTSGSRTRYWSACLSEDFAQISLGGGRTENFRETEASRFRHRIMRKTTYLNEKLGGPACVGCGRCSLGCPADIADPVHIISKIMES